MGVDHWFPMKIDENCVFCLLFALLALCFDVFKGKLLPLFHRSDVCTECAKACKLPGGGFGADFVSRCPFWNLNSLGESGRKKMTNQHDKFG